MTNLAPQLASVIGITLNTTMALIEVIANDRLGRKGKEGHWNFKGEVGLPSSTLVRVKCSPEDTVGDLKKLIGAQTGTDPSKIQLKKW